MDTARRTYIKYYMYVRYANLNNFQNFLLFIGIQYASNINILIAYTNTKH